MISGFLAMSSLMIFLALIAVFYSNRMETNTQRILVENVSSQKAAEELEIALLEMKGLTAYYVLDDNPQWLDTFQVKKETFLYWLNEARHRIHSSEENSIANSIDSLFTTYVFWQQKTINYAQQGEKAKAHQILINNMLLTFNNIFAQCEELLSINEKLMFNTSSMIDRDNRTVNSIMYILGFAGIFFGLGLGLFLSRKITHPIYNLVLRIKGAAQDEVIEKVDIEKLTELEHLDAWVHQLIDKVQKANDDLRQSQKMLQRSEKLASLGKIAAGLAHEIRNPLTAIKMLFFSIQNELGQSQKLKQDVQVIIAEIGHIEKFIQDFLDFARPPKPDLNYYHVDKIVQNTISLLSPQLHNAHIKIEQSSKLSCPQVYVDEEQIKQVLLNILLNAVQALPPGGKIYIKENVTDFPVQQKKFIHLEITDNGPGIPANLINSIFDPFITSKEDGTGLGLSIADQIIHNHGGWIEAKNNEKGGASFFIYLPLPKG